MAQQLTFTLKKKDNPDIEVTLAWLSTTPAREIASIGAFPFKDKDTLLDKEMIKEYLGMLENELATYDSYYKRRLDKINDLKNSILKVEKPEIFRLLKDDLEEEESMIEETQAVQGEWRGYIRMVEYVMESWESNEKDWDLYYSNY